MKTPAKPIDEAERQSVLDDLNIVYSQAEERFDRITRLAKRLFDVPIALISLVNEDSQWFKSCQGLTVSETDRDISFCGHAIHSNDPFIVLNAPLDERFSDNPLVTGEPGIRFYAGQPINFFNQNLGTLCIIDNKPRGFGQEEIDSLKSLASWVESEILTWRNTENTFVNKVLNATERKALLDPVTADLNADGIDLILSSIHTETSEGNRPTGLKIEILELDSLHNIDVVNTTIKGVACCVRTALDSRGLQGLYSPKSILCILEDKNDINTQLILKQIKEALSTFHIKLGDNLYNPKTTITLVDFSKE